jgi:hypothetical protein
MGALVGNTAELLEQPVKVVGNYINTSYISLFPGGFAEKI